MFWEERAGSEPRDACVQGLLCRTVQGCQTSLYVLEKRVPELRVGLARHFLTEWNASPFSETLKSGGHLLA